MNKYFVAALCMLMATRAIAKDVSGKTYDFDLPDDVIFESKEPLEFYTFTWGSAPDLSLFMLHVHPAPMPPSSLEWMANMMEDALDAQLREHDGFSGVQTKRSSITSGPFAGIELEFIVTVTDGTLIRQYMYILHDGERAWNGQLTALTPGANEIAHLIMSGARKKHAGETHE